MFLLLLALTASAAEVEEVDIWAEDAVRRARAKVVDELKGLGYTRIKRKDGRTILAHERNWKGKVVLHDDGFVTYRRQAPRVQRPPTTLPGATKELAWFSCVTQPTRCVQIGGIVVSGRKLDQQKARTHRDVSADINDLGDRLADRSVQRRLQSLPDRLVQLWEEGVPLDGDKPLPTYEARRAALLAFWETRTGNAWGERVREAVEAFLRAEVQHSDHPLSDEELEAFNARSHAGRALTLRNPHAESLR